MRTKDLQAEAEKEEFNPFYVSFSDLMVLLCVFFIMLVSMSEIETPSFERVRTGFTGSTENTLVELDSNLRRIVELDPGVPGVKVHLETDGLRLDMDTVALFDVGSARLRPNALEPIRPVLDELLKTQYSIDVEGHTDDQPLYRLEHGEITTNWSLSGRRASTVAQYLIDAGFEESKIRIVGYAATRPKVPIEGKTEVELEAARAENRRVSLVVR